MKKFVIHRNSIIEVECTKLSTAENPSIAWLPSGEYWARIDAPVSIFDKVDAKLVNPIWHSFAFFQTMDDAKKKMEANVRDTFDRNKRKSGTEYTEADIAKQLADIQVITL